MKFYIWACLALMTWPSAFAMYYLGSKDIFKPPTTLREDSYFGYSITYDTFNKLMVISAPRANEYGEVYNCNMYNQTCTNIPRTIVEQRPPKYDHDYWFGATVKAGVNYVMMCAPRYSVFLPHFKDVAEQGRCYSYEKGKLIERKIISFYNDRLPDCSSPMEKTMDSFGWSIDIASDDSIIVGGPGMFHGRAMVYRSIAETPKLIRYDKLQMAEFNVGYAVASGLFLKPNKRYKNMTYAVGSPYRFGQVILWKVGKNGHYSTGSALYPPADRSVVGSMFGAVLCAAKLTLNRTDLLVGAPTYATKDPVTHNLGAVYVYLSYDKDEYPQFKRMIVGQASGGMFGSAIVRVGDLNGDDRDEIVISAPFENQGHGVVYLYSGAALVSDVPEKDLKYLQRIEPEPGYGESFGMSLTPVGDYDDNGCNEIAIGSPYKDTVVLFKCMASVIITTLKPNFSNLQGRTKSGRTNFEFDVCLSVTYPTLPEKVIASIMTTVEMTHEDAKLADPTGRFTFVTNLADKKPDYCIKVPFILPLHGKYETEIRYTISSELQNDPRNLTDFDSSRVILSDRSELKHLGSLWAAECAGNICMPKLTLTPEISIKDSEPYEIGSSEIETMKLSVRNGGEVAYEPCVRAHIAGVTVRAPGGCVYELSADGDRLKCEPPRPLQLNEEWTTGLIELDMTQLTNLQEKIDITLYLHNRCNSDPEEVRPLSYPLKVDSTKFVVNSETDIGDVILMKEDDIKNNGITFQHVYTIFNYGNTYWKDLSIYVTLEQQPYISYEGVTIYYSTLTLYTECLPLNETSMTYLCKLGSLMPVLEFGKVLVTMNTVPGKLDGLVDEDKNVTITSELKIQYNEMDLGMGSVITTLALQDATVPLDIIIIAVAVALFILIIIALILYRVGFLRRKKREELERLKKSVKRQTILRRSTMPSQSRANSDGATEDRRQILEGMQEEDEHCPPPSTK